MDKAIRAMLIGAGLPVKFWPYAFRHFLLRIKNSALPRRDATESAHQKLHGEKCQPRGQCASVDDRGASSECKPLIYCSHNSHSLFSYTVILARLELTMGKVFRL